MAKNGKIKILMLSAEVAPFAKVGGLADVVGSLPPALRALGADVRVAMPLYGLIGRDRYKLRKIYSDLEVPSGRVLVKVGIWQGKLPGTDTPVYFIDAPAYFAERAVYTGGDNSERFLFFTLAALYALPALGFSPDIVHCHDYHTALAPDIIKASNLLYLKGLKTLYTIHNLSYQGKSETRVLSTGNLAPESLATLTRDAADGDINFMAQGILNADLVNTVSPAYAKEIAHSVYGAHLDRVVRLRKDGLYGILNGIDAKSYDPRTDRHIKAHYGEDGLERKAVNKEYLQAKFGLPRDKETAVIGFVGRLAWQKGLDLLGDNLRRLNAQFVFLGDGKKEYVEHLEALARKRPEQFAVRIGFDEALSRQVYAGSDLFLMPSRFEPCGLGQMYAMRYGAVPVVRATGGLKDTVTPALGFRFREISKTAVFKVLEKALEAYYRHPAEWRKMQARGMTQDLSWDRSAREYLGLYRKLLSTGL